MIYASPGTRRSAIFRTYKPKCFFWEKVRLFLSFHQFLYNVSVFKNIVLYITMEYIIIFVVMVRRVWHNFQSIYLLSIRSRCTLETAFLCKLGIRVHVYCFFPSAEPVDALSLSLPLNKTSMLFFFFLLVTFSVL